MNEIILGFKSGETYLFDGSVKIITEDESGACIDWCFELDELEYVTANKMPLGECE